MSEKSVSDAVARLRDLGVDLHGRDLLHVERELRNAYGNGLHDGHQAGYASGKADYQQK